MSLPFQSDIINLKRLAEVSGISYNTLYGMKIGRTGKRTKLSVSDRTKLANALLKELKPTFEELGFEVVMNRTEDPLDLPGKI